MATISGRLVNYLERLLSIQSHEISRDHSQTNGISLLSHYISIPERPGGPCPPLLFSTFLRSKKKKGRQRKKGKGVSKQKLLKGCHQGQNAIVLAILEPLEFNFFLSDNHGSRQYFSVFHGPPLLNPFHKP